MKSVTLDQLNAWRNAEPSNGGRGKDAITLTIESSLRAFIESTDAVAAVDNSDPEWGSGKNAQNRKGEPLTAVDIAKRFNRIAKSNGWDTVVRAEGFLTAGTVVVSKLTDSE
jgi:hypothetical protein